MAQGNGRQQDMMQSLLAHKTDDITTMMNTMTMNEKEGKSVQCRSTTCHSSDLRDNPAFMSGSKRES
eukprot:4578651-Amphidinium_carterae.1